MAAGSKWIFQTGFIGSTGLIHPVNPVILSINTWWRLPKVIADIYHLNTSLKLAYRTGRDKAEDREKEGET